MEPPFGEEQGARSSHRNFHVINVSTSVSATPGGHRDDTGDTVSLSSQQGKKIIKQCVLQKRRMISAKKFRLMLVLWLVSYPL